MDQHLRSNTELAVVTCLGVDLELAHVPHFMRHYTSIGVAARDIHVLLNTADPDSPNLEAAEAMLAAFSAAPPTRWIAAYTSDTMWAERRRLQQKLDRPDAWILNADIDEHHQYPAPLDRIVAHCRAKGYNAVQGFLIDRLATGGDLAALADAPPLAAQYPLESEVDLSIMGRGAHHGVDGTLKLMLHHASVLPSRGGHNPSPEGAPPRFVAGGRLASFPRATDPAFRFAYPFRVDHYKWTATRLTTFRRRLATPGVSPAGRETGEKMTTYLARHGRVRLEDVAVRPPGARRTDAGWTLFCLRMRLAARARQMRRRLPGRRV